MVLSAAVHHSRPVVNLGGDYRQAWFYVRRKWRDRLPIQNLVCPITVSPITVLEKDLRIRFMHRGRRVRRRPEETPQEIARKLGYET